MINLIKCFNRTQNHSKSLKHLMQFWQFVLSQSAAHYTQFTPMVAPPTAPGYTSPYDNPATLTMTEMAIAASYGMGSQDS